ncbi:hypothetical protein Gotur_009579, partial [Gossypium turneri]
QIRLLIVEALLSTQNKHSSEDRILETYIRNLPTHLSSLIEPYLRGARFLQVACMWRGCKLDSTPVSTLVERWRPKTCTFHLPCGECTITLEDMQLQLIGEMYASNF